MGQGSIKWQNKLMLNCRESILHTISENLNEKFKEYASDEVLKLFKHCQKELEWSPPGCVLLDFDKHLLSEESKEELVGYLTNLYGNCSDRMEEEKYLIRSIIQLLKLGLKSLDEAHIGNQKV